MACQDCGAPTAGPDKVVCNACLLKKGGGKLMDDVEHQKALGAAEEERHRLKTLQRMRTGLVYVAGPLVNGGNPLQWRNVGSAVAAADAVRRAGYTPITPHLSMFADFMLPASDERTWLDWSMSVLRNCEALVLVPGLEIEALTGGTLEELKLAKSMAIPIFDGPKALRHYEKGIATLGYDCIHRAHEEEAHAEVAEESVGEVLAEGDGGEASG